MTWEKKTLSDVADFYNGKAHEKEISENGEFIVVNSKYISRDGSVIKRTKSQHFPLFQGDIVMVMSDVPNGKALAKCLIIDEDNLYSLNQRICCIRAKEGVFLPFLKYQLNRNKYFLGFNNGETQTNLRKADILDCPIYLPPLPVQKKIVEKLDAAFAEIDRAVEIANERHINTSSLIAAVQNSLFEDMPLSIPRLKLSEVAKFENGDRGKNYPSKKYQISEGVPFVNAGDFSLDGDITRDGMAYISEERFDLLGAGKFKKDDVLFCLRGSLGKSAINKTLKRGAIASSLVIIRALQERVHADYLYAFMRSDIVKKYISETAGGAAQPNLSAKVVMGYKIPVPSSEEQKVIADKFWALRQRGLDAISLIKKKKSELMALKIAILNQAFSGEFTKDAA